MAKVLRWTGYVVAGLLLLVLLAAAWIWFASARALASPGEGRAETLVRPTPAQAADAGRQAKILGCVTCHGEGLQGTKFFDEPNVGTIWAPNVTAVAARASDQQLARAIRQGIGIDGRPLLIMPSEHYQHLSDGETAALIGYIRGLPRSPKQTGENVIGPLGRIGLATGNLLPAPAVVEQYSSMEPVQAGAQFSAGHRIAKVVCSGCHGATLEGREPKPGLLAPDLDIAAGYDLDQFRTLLRTGVPPSGKKLELMDIVSRNDFSNFTDEEIAQLHAYLQARAQR